MLATIFACAPHASFAPVVSLDAIEGSAQGHAFAFAEDICPIEDPLANLLSEELLASVSRFVKELPPRLQEIAHRHYWLDQSQSEIADDLGVTRSAICHALAKIHNLGKKYLNVHLH